MTDTQGWTSRKLRFYYRGLRDRAYAARPIEWVYIALLWADWDKQLGELKAASIRDIVVNHLVAAIDSVDDSHADSLLEWLDAFPSAIVTDPDGEGAKANWQGL